MNSSLKISIVTPSYNQRNFIEQALESVRKQKYHNLEHVVIDGGSTDGTVEYLRSLSGRPEWHHLTWVSEADNGQSDALNKGFALASGDIVGWLNSDDLYRPGCFARVAEALAARPDVDILYGDYTWVDATGQLLQLRREVKFNAFVLLYHRTLCVPSPSSFFRRRIFDDFNFIETSYHYSMDWEFFLRLAHRGYRFYHLPELLADFRWQPDSKTSRFAFKQFEERDRILYQYATWLPRVPTLWRPICILTVRCAAALRYWTEKLVRGYYYERWLFARKLRRHSTVSAQ